MTSKSASVLHKLKTSAVAFIGIMPTLGSALCGPLFQSGLRLYRPLILTSNQPSMRCIPKPLKWVSHFSFDLLINFPLSQMRESLYLFVTAESSVHR
jgi:hypothetical protein